MSEEVARVYRSCRLDLGPANTEREITRLDQSVRRSPQRQAQPAQAINATRHARLVSVGLLCVFALWAFGSLVTETSIVFSGE